MKTLNSHAGYVIVDHSNSPGLTPDDLAHVPGFTWTPELGPGRVFERDFKVCTHCQGYVVLNPGRVRDRAVCPKCHHYICDYCDAAMKAGAVCVPFELVLERVMEHDVTSPETPVDLAAAVAPPPPRIVVPG